MFKKIKKIFFNLKTLITLLILLIIIGWGLAVYFGLKVNSNKDLCSDYQNKIEKLGRYSSLLKKSMELIRQNKSLDVLEDDVKLIGSGPLSTEWENAVFSGKKEDAEYYLDVIIDSLTFFSK